MEIKQIFYINKTKFVCDFVENLCKSNGLSCFTLTETSDFSYLITDLKPKLVIIDKSALDENSDQFWSGLKESEHSGYKTMLVGDSNDSFDISYNGSINATTFANDLKNHIK